MNRQFSKKLLSRVERLLRDRVEICPDSMCWNWLGAVNDKGYGQITHNSMRYYIHRCAYAWMTNARFLGRTSVCCHKCDNPKCCNPGHLFIGSQAQNLLDMRQKGRGKSNPPRVRGEQHGNAKMTPETVLQIRKKRSEGVLLRTLAKEFGLGVPSVSGIVNRRTWTHI